MDEQINENLKNSAPGKSVFMLVFAAIGGMVRMLLWAVNLLFIANRLRATNGKLTNRNNILGFGRSLSIYTYHNPCCFYCLIPMCYPSFCRLNLTAELKIPDTSNK